MDNGTVRHPLGQPGRADAPSQLWWSQRHWASLEQKDLRKMVLGTAEDDILPGARNPYQTLEAADWI